MRTLTKLRAAVLAAAAIMIGACDSGSAGDPPAGTFTEIYDTYFPSTTNARCSFCHGMPPSDISNGNLATGADQDSAYAALVGPTSTSSKCGGMAFVVPHDPDASLFLDKFSAVPECGDRMPLGGKVLDDAQVEMVRSWIDAGAQND